MLARQWVTFRLSLLTKANTVNTAKVTCKLNSNKALDEIPLLELQGATCHMESHTIIMPPDTYRRAPP